MGTEWQRVRATDQSRFSIEEQERDALALLQALGVQRSHVIGHSYGAVTALQLACDAPLAGRSLVLLETTQDDGHMGSPVIGGDVVSAPIRIESGHGISFEKGRARRRGADHKRTTSKPWAR